ncbi:murein transglycosylase A [Janthinobacterium sp. 17J80-10]|uniref:murein transglycosylase A n=1 Tax=Janthinobacterium sp. 17J80-10 TaxID=2497863 RepID=UPI00100552A7|nr:murein transglycosylase A [Janthinobacterium sp. 17J80-10]QAU35783.1 murein transglycosylase [Janthinobacterium sp. 17J80-10]
MKNNRLSLLVSAFCVAFGMLACTTVPPETRPVPPEPVKPAPAETLKPVAFADLPGWQEDDLRAAWPALLSSCQVLIKKPDWKEPCEIARTVNATETRAMRTFLESFFVPHRVANADGSEEGLVTGYYEPLLRGARKRGGPYQTPLHGVPDDLLVIDMATLYPELKNMRLRGKLAGRKVVPYPSRGDMEQANALAGKELVWVDDPVEAFFMQVQGSGRIELTDSKETVRLAYAEQNGHPYKSIGRYLVDKGEMTLAQASAQSIKAWVAANPARRQEVLNANPSYVFFREEKLPDPQLGPKGSQGVPLTSQRSIAVDPQFIPMGAPVFLSTTQPNSARPLQRLMLAQDTGGAIRGAVRADFFWGFGHAAGESAGKMKQPGRMWVLLPKLPAVK